MDADEDIRRLFTTVKKTDCFIPKKQFGGDSGKREKNKPSYLSDNGF
jgi:hypothetical protein